ncbi:pimeloyl-ACP methyl ester esterase BioH [Pelagibaculum spongiae]|uniref:Pimeloyl-[acyl-carrier protein] methyl ester esterase n=1 Tax=Pelagibaculum spongiae TaxID=2080658 RepID=A0A2V1GVA4_9GAMM|nr:pimeloyl-ACP methyl ester esterase BioH [Pelagibaculum spongiae]PVZ63554.1 pimeloyl-[acyl-carrier protein] methyl ester esterase [Pelagibaculum spongiae]
MIPDLFYEVAHSKNTEHGPELVLLHGWGMHSGIWEPLLPQLSQHFRVTLIDLPGFGRSPQVKPYNLQMVTDAVLKVAPEKAIWLGWSLGGIIALNAALKSADRVEKLVLAASTAKFIQDDDWRYAIKPDVLKQFHEMLSEDFEAVLIRFLSLQAMGSETMRKDIALLKDIVFRHGEPAPLALRGGLEILRDADLRYQLADLTQPVLQICGKKDGLVPVRAAPLIEDLINQSSSSGHCQTKVIEKASHAPFLSHPEQFLAALTEFTSASSKAVEQASD